MYAVAHSVRELSRGLTRDRALAGERYLGSPELLGAYLLHFWPISYCQASLCLAMMRSPVRPGGLCPRRRGPAPGPFRLALLAPGYGP